MDLQGIPLAEAPVLEVYSATQLIYSSAEEEQDSIVSFFLEDWQRDEAHLGGKRGFLDDKVVLCALRPFAPCLSTFHSVVQVQLLQGIGNRT